jgi:hypothetical protein
VPEPFVKRSHWASVGVASGLRLRKLKRLLGVCVWACRWRSFQHALELFDPAGVGLATFHCRTGLDRDPALLRAKQTAPAPWQPSQSLDDDMWWRGKPDAPTDWQRWLAFKLAKPLV